MRSRRMLLLPVVLAVFLLGLVRDMARNEDALRVHVVCPQHGELLHASAAPRKHDEISADKANKHDNGCQLADLADLPGTEPASPPDVGPAPSWSVLATFTAPRGPPTVRSPLLVAPKTSPPMV